MTAALPCALTRAASASQMGTTAGGARPAGRRLMPVAAEMIRVMVIDDSATMREYMCEQLGEVGVHDIIEAASGEDALVMLRSLGAAGPDVIVCDLNMTQMDGIEFCNRVRRDDRIPNRSIPVLILTGERDDLIQNVARQAIAARVLTTPISPPDLLRHIESTVGFCRPA